MAKRSGRSGPSNPRRKTGVVRGRRALNAFRIDKEDVDQNARDEEEILDDSDEGVKTEDDEDIDSDEAFDEEDEERYSTFKFSGSSSKGRKAMQKTLQEGSSKGKEAENDTENEEEEEEDEDEEEMYMDLSEMLADGQGTNGASKSVKGKTVATEDSEEESEEEDSEEEDDLLLDDSEAESEQDDDQLDSLGAFVDSLASTKKESKPQPTTESSALTSTVEKSNELSMSDIVASLTDPSLQSFRKSLVTQQSSKSKNIGQKLSVPLARPIQQKLDREAAYEETKAEISKWQPLVKANREADHLQFPLNEPQVTAKQSTATLAGTFEPSTEMEKKIDEILRDSGIKDEKDITSFEELALKKVSIDEVRQRQAELRAMRGLMFRQDQKAKRIAKIKSKTYRRIHKREREREVERRMAEEGSDGEEMQDRRMKMEAARAKERMTLRHKNTGDWAKKMLSRGQHDLETRQAISEQIRRGDDLRRKILGDEEDEEEESDDSAEELEDLMRDPNKWGDDEVEETTAVRKGVMGMKFMTDAEERQRQANTKELAELRAAMDAGSEDEDGMVEVGLSTQNINLGRKTFTPGDQAEPSDATEESARKRQEEIELRIVKNPFHMSEVQLQATNTNSEAARQAQTTSLASSTSRIGPSTADKSSTTNGKLKSSIHPASAPSANGAPIDNPWLSLPVSKQSKKKSPENRIEKIQKKRKAGDLDSSEAHVNIDTSVEVVIEKLKAAADEAADDEDAPSMTYGRGKVAFKQIDLINRAFAGDDLEADFIAEKEAAIAEDAPKEEDLTLPGWGSWAGQGVKRRATEKKLIKKIPGIDASKRKDAKLKNVIINEKRPKANTKYLVTGAVPYPYETREQYERSLSMPVGPEFITREMYQKMTKPRISIKSGAVVNPLRAPFK